MTCVKYSALNRCQTCLGDPVEISTLESLHVSKDMVSLLTFFNIEICEGLPNSICSKCVRTFESIITFKHQCVVSQTFLQNLFKEYLTNAAEDLKQTVEEKESSAAGDFNTNDGIKVEEIKEEEEDDGTFAAVSCVKVDTNDSSSVDDNSEKASPITHKKKKTGEKKSRSTETTGEIACTKCPFRCNTNDELTTHCQKKHDTVCNICNKILKNNRSLKRHKEVHKDRPKFYCEICKKFYNSKKTYGYHMKTLHSETSREKIVCSLCGVAVYEIKHHMRSKHTESKDQFPCTYCKKVFKSHTRLRAHAVIYHENSEHYISLCPECGKVFRTPSDMKAHYKQKHTDTFDYQCRFCVRKFKAFRHCNKHEKIVHFNERPYKCEMCSKAFSLKSILDDHIRTHTGEKPFVCDVCSRGFAQRVTLRTHMRLVHNIGKIKSNTQLE